MELDFFSLEDALLKKKDSGEENAPVNSEESQKGETPLEEPPKKEKSGYKQTFDYNNLSSLSREFSHYDDDDDYCSYTGSSYTGSYYNGSYYNGSYYNGSYLPRTGTTPEFQARVEQKLKEIGQQLENLNKSFSEAFLVLSEKIDKRGS